MLMTMKKIIACLAIVVGSLQMVHAQSSAIKPRISAFTQQYLIASKKLKDSKARLPEYVYKKINNKTYISAFIKVGSDVEQSKLDALGVFIGTRAGDIWTAQIPVENISSFITVPGIKYIDLDAPIFPVLDSARKQTKADSAQSGIYLPAPMTGKNVVVGVIDAGFDFTHPTMYDTTHSGYRIKRVWTQKLAGTPPTGFAYGNEMTDSDVIRAQGYDTAILSHGTHVTGIAAGSGYGSNANNRRFRGMAFESDIVLVGIMPAPAEWEVAAESDIIDGMNYIYTYAASVGKPAVVNLSWGATIGPHDGNSLFSQACDALTGAGKIFVCAAGNNGEDTVHLQKIFSGTDTTVSTFVTFSPYLDTANQKTWVDVWGDSSSSFCLNIKLYNADTAIDSTPFLCVTDTNQTYNLIGSNGDTCFVTMTMANPEYNGKPHALLYFYSRVHDNICLSTRSSSAVVNMWEGYVLPPEGYYGYLLKKGYPFAVSGDAVQTVSDIGCTRSAITSAAYTSKLSFKIITGATYSYSGAGLGIGKIAPFSSFGPTEDNRIKPDIAAPGFGLASSVNSYDTSYNYNNANYTSIISIDTIGGRKYPYAMLAGTSMASPCVSGIVAMLLQLNPSLTPDSVKSIIAATAITDTHTGTLPAAGNTTWGHGKINAYKALRYMAGTLSVENTLTADPLDCILYPNPNNGGFTIAFNSKTQEQLTVSVLDITGRLVSTQYWFVNEGANTKQFSTGKLAKGVYFTKVSSLSGSDVIRMVVE